MTTITIPQKMSNSGTIYDLASDCFDIEIDMGSRYEYAVCLPSYYNANPTRHKTESAAIRQHDKLARMGYQGIQILDRNGRRLDVLKDFWNARLVYVD